MSKNRMEAFSDGVLAVIITIMVLDLHAPAGATLAAMRPLLPLLLIYVLSFLYIGIYWNNHHHLLHAVQQVNGGVLWANLNLLFWLSLAPFTTAWAGAHLDQAWPQAIYGFDLLLAAIAYFILVQTLVRLHGHGSRLAAAIGRDWKGKLSIVVYAVALSLAFVRPWIATAGYFAVAIAWLVPDRRIEAALGQAEAPGDRVAE
ncbi:MAG TPA: TMEM175 family protein [Terriglobales bacterium]|nr:TMEM175 family protein [Terriglobales bacterium]